MWHLISTIHFNQKPITHHFFASYHGHSLCDSHAAADKQVIKREYISSQQQRMITTSPTLYWGPNSANDLQLLITKKIKNTQVIVLNSIDRDPELRPKVCPLDRIKQKHCFVYKNNECFAYELSTEVTTSYPIPFMFKYL